MAPTQRLQLPGLTIFPRIWKAFHTCGIQLSRKQVSSFKGAEFKGVVANIYHARPLPSLNATVLTAVSRCLLMHSSHVSAVGVRSRINSIASLLSRWFSWAKKKNKTLLKFSRRDAKLKWCIQTGVGNYARDLRSCGTNSLSQSETEGFWNWLSCKSVAVRKWPRGPLRAKRSVAGRSWRRRLVIGITSVAFHQKKFLILKLWQSNTI